MAISNVKMEYPRIEISSIFSFFPCAVNKCLEFLLVLHQSAFWLVDGRVDRVEPSGACLRISHWKFR